MADAHHWQAAVLTSSSVLLQKTLCRFFNFNFFKILGGFFVVVCLVGFVVGVFFLVFIFIENQ